MFDKLKLIPFVTPKKKIRHNRNQSAENTNQIFIDDIMKSGMKITARDNVPKTKRLFSMVLNLDDHRGILRPIVSATAYE